MKDKKTKLKRAIRPGYRVKGNPDKLSRELRDIRAKHGKITSDLVLDRAKDSASCLHDEFEWDDTKAAKRYRKYQARYIIRAISIDVVVKDEISKKPEFITVKVDDEIQWVPREVVAVSEEFKSSALALAVKELYSIQAKYTELIELCGVWKEVDRVKKKHSKVIKRKMKVS